MTLYSRRLYNGIKLILPYTTPVNHKLTNQSNGPSVKILDARCYRTGPNSTYDDDGDSEIPPEVFKNLFDRKALKKGFKTLLGECRKWVDEKKEFSILNPKEYRLEEYRGVIDMLFTFDNETDLKKFVLTTDSANNEGYSSASFTLTPQGTALFSGYISTKIPKDKDMVITGYANIMTNRKRKSFRRLTYHNWLGYTHLVLKIRGDGHTYGFILPVPGREDVTWYNQYMCPLYTRGGPYWQIVKIPFSHFIFTQKGNTRDDQSVTLPLDHIARLGITLCNVYEGPFKLEIDYIGLERKCNYLNVSPYEQYMGPNKVLIL